MAARALTDAQVRRLNDACVGLMRLSAAKRRDCMREKGGCMGIGWCEAAWALSGVAGPTCGGPVESQKAR